MGKRLAILAALACAPLGAGAAAIGCSTDAPSTPNTDQVYSVALTVATRSALPACTSALAGTVAYVLSPPSLWRCASFEWNQILCTANSAGSVAYASATQTLFACVSRQWTPIALPEAGPPGPQGPPGEAGVESLVKLTAEPPGPNCRAGGQRIDVGIDKNGDGVLQPSEITQTAYVCNGLGADAAPAMDAAEEPNAFQQYAINYAQAFCTQNLQCCNGYPNGYDFATCVAEQQTGGFENTLPNDPLAYTNGNLTLNPDAGAGCLSALASLGCNTSVTASNNAGITNSCYGVFRGTIPVGGGGCVDSFECVDGYCNIAVDGGLITVGQSGGTSVTRTTGVCTALVGNGGSCTTSQQCTAASAQPSSFCNGLLTAGAGTCQGLLPDDAGCMDPTGTLYDLACQSELCAGGPNGQSCGGSYTFDSTNGFCIFYADDAGGGG